MATNLSEKDFLNDRNHPARPLTTVLEASQVFSGELSTRVAFEQVLGILKRSHDVVRGAVALLDPKSQEIRVEVSTGLSDAGRLTRYRIGEGVIGRVVATGKPIVVPRVSREPMFLNRAGKRDLNKQEITYMCVPVVVKGKTVGALGVDLRFKADRDYESELKCLELIAAMMAQAIKAEHLVNDERRRLIHENSATVTTLSLAEAIAGFEKDIVQDALKTTRGNCAKAARLLATTERILNYKIRKYGIDSKRFRN